ncbi:cupin domain-containing protein [Desulfovibrio inopinatus]|uniref:cupin domain-containing protein n=1 Tax=Desulfovibrio inopinatus TaxID=102109 RepID=UPI000425E428|nr:cupin domain-containing protein [Desulfovibrio inopinatus]
MSDYAKAQVFKMSELPSSCPAKHIDTEAFVLIPKETGAKHYTLFCTEVHPGGEAELDTHPGREHCYFVLSGVGDAEVDGEKFRLRVGDCLWIPPGAEHGVKPVGGQTLRFAVVVSPPPWSDPLPESNDYAPAKVFSMEELPSACPPKHIDTDAFVLIPKETGAKHYTLFCTEVRPGGEAELDTHPGREHCYFILSGTGDAEVEGEKFLLNPGDCLWIPPGAAHGVKPVGGQTLRFAVVVSPAPWTEL